MTPDQARIVRWLDLPARAAALSAIDAIFFASSNTQSFASEEIRRAFRERWLGRYLVHDPDHAWVALAHDGRVIGYLVGAFDDPAQAPRFGDIAYFAELASATRHYPAHLHVNLAVEARGAGVGSELVRAFVRSVEKAGLPGVHIVTSRAARNVGFYTRLGFLERAGVLYRGHPLVMLGRDLTTGT